jgi:hypothetical protein
MLCVPSTPVIPAAAALGESAASRHTARTDITTGNPSPNEIPVASLLEVPPQEDMTSVIQKSTHATQHRRRRRDTFVISIIAIRYVSASSPRLRILFNAASQRKVNAAPPAVLPSRSVNVPRWMPAPSRSS